MFFFAWCDAGEAFGPAHQREDEIVFAFDLAHLEGQHPTLSIDIRNPHIGLLAPGRKQWAWLSYAGAGVVGTMPLFYGRLVALPSNLLGEIATLQFIARPNDYLAQKQAIANGLMVEPYYDPIWIDPTKFGDPDTVLETYAMTWHIDRVTHVVSISDILFGEDGTENFAAEDSFYSSVSINFAQSPQTQVVFDGSVQWTQAATGSIRMPDVAIIAWNGQQIINDWPKPGDQLHHGWSVLDASMTNWDDATASNNPTVIIVGGGTETVSSPPIITTIGGGTGGGGFSTQDVTPTFGGTSPSKTGPADFSVSWHSDKKTHIDGEVIGFSESVNYDEQGGMGAQGSKVTNHSLSFSFTDTPYASHVVSSFSESISWAKTIGVAQTAPSTAPPTTDGDGGGGPITIPSLFGQMLLQYDLSFPRTETIKFVMNSEVQAVVLLPLDEPVNQIKLSMHGSDLGLPIDPGGALPIGNPGRSAFFPTDRGQLAMQYPMLVARAHLMQSARAAKISFDCTFERAMGLSCRKNALLHDPRLPGGQVVGKITEYHLIVDGDNGQLEGKVQIETTIGTGLSIVIDEGDPSYVDEGFVFVGYQFYSNTDVALPSGDASIVMPQPVFDPTQMVLPLTYAQAVMAFAVHEGTPVDVVLAGGAGAIADPTWLEIVLMPVTGQKFETDYDLGSSRLVLPKLIDLAAPNA